MQRRRGQPRARAPPRQRRRRPSRTRRRRARRHGRAGASAVRATAPHCTRTSLLPVGSERFGQGCALCSLCGPHGRSRARGLTRPRAAPTEGSPGAAHAGNRSAPAARLGSGRSRLAGPRIQTHPEVQVQAKATTQPSGSVRISSPTSVWKLWIPQLWNRRCPLEPLKRILRLYDPWSAFGVTETRVTRQFLGKSENFLRSNGRAPTRRKWNLARVYTTKDTRTQPRPSPVRSAAADSHRRPAAKLIVFRTPQPP
jgi:hypothetical protein